MTTGQLKAEFHGLLKDYLELGDNAAIIVHQLEKTAKADTRNKLIRELQNLDKKRTELLSQIE